MSRRKSRIPVFINKKNNNNEKEEFSPSLQVVFSIILVFGQLRNFVVSHGLFLKIQGGQAVFIFI
jgi:hypothetical protein